MGKKVGGDLFLSYKPSCTFKHCRAVTSSSGKLCPRHSLLVGIYGKKEAENMELGYRCDSCKQRRMTDKPQDCEVCQTEACSVCRASQACCKATAREMESERNTLEIESHSLEARLHDLRSRP